MNTREVIDRIFKEPGVQFELTELENLGKPIHEILSGYPKAATTGKDAGKMSVSPRTVWRKTNCAP
jgi:type I restriction enzyme M protein